MKPAPTLIATFLIHDVKGERSAQLKTGGTQVVRLAANGAIQIEDTRTASRDIPLGTYNSEDLKITNVNNRFVLESKLHGTRKCDFKDVLTLRCERATDPHAPLRLLVGLLI
jgi:hypothetical protein